MRGTVKWFSNIKGYGFIVPDGSPKGAKDLFVHYTGIEKEGFKDLAQGDRVEFQVEKTDKGPQATHVQVLPKPPKKAPRPPPGARGDPT